MIGNPQAAASSAARPSPSGLSPAHQVRTGEDAGLLQLMNHTGTR